MQRLYKELNKKLQDCTVKLLMEKLRERITMENGGMVLVFLKIYSRKMRRIKSSYTFLMMLCCTVLIFPFVRCQKNVNPDANEFQQDFTDLEINGVHDLKWGMVDSILIYFEEGIVYKVVSDDSCSYNRKITPSFPARKTITNRLVIENLMESVSHLKMIADYSVDVNKKMVVFFPGYIKNYYLSTNLLQFRDSVYIISDKLYDDLQNIGVIDADDEKVMTDSVWESMGY